MALRKALVVVNGQLQQIQTGDTIVGADGTLAGLFGTTTNTYALETLASTGIAVRTGSNTWTTRTITGTASDISVTNGDGISGNPTIDLINTGTPVTLSFVKVTTDTKGRVSATTPVVTADITTLVDATYVNVSGDSMSSGANLTFVGGGTATGIPTPTFASDAAPKSYVDSISAGISPNVEVQYATTADLNTAPGGVWTPAGSQVGATLTHTTSGAVMIDGFTIVNGDRILVKNQTIPADNGIYVVSNGTGLVTLTRATDFDGSPSGEVTGGDFVFVDGGTFNGGTGWTVVNSGTVNVDTDAMNWTKFSAATVISEPAFQILYGTGLGSPVDSDSEFTFVADDGTFYVNTLDGITPAGHAAPGIVGIASSTKTGSSGAGGAIRITAGNGFGTGTGGRVRIYAGNSGSGATGNGGAVDLVSGNSAATNGAGGVINMLAGNGLGTGAGGVVTIQGGTSETGTAGPVHILAGSATVGGTAGGEVTVTAGDGGPTDANGGSVTLVGGLKTGTGLYGSVEVKTGAGISRLKIDGTGAWLVGGTAGTSGQALKSNGAGTPPTWASITSGTVTSVAFSDGSTTPIYTVTGSPVTSSGTLTITLTSQSANTVFAAPNGSAGQPTFRGLLNPDLPIVNIAHGGTGQITATLGFNALSPTTTKGDLIVREVTDNVRLPVGTNGQVLTADSTTASGVKWAGGTSFLSSLTAAVASNTINNGDFEQRWNWALTTAAKTAFTFGENTASINGAGAQYLVDITTLAASTAAPLHVAARAQTVVLVGADGTLALTAASGTVGTNATLAAGAGTAGAGGNVSINAGDGVGGAGGNITLTGGDSVGTAGYLEIVTDALSRLKILGTGAWQLAGDAGTSGYVLSSNGASAAPTWALNFSGTVTSVAVASDSTTNSALTVVSGSPITTTGTIHLALDPDLVALAGLATNGLVTRTGSATYDMRTIVSGGTLTVTNGNGVSANPSLDLTSGIVTPGTYTSVTVDTYGRVTSGTNPPPTYLQVTATNLNAGTIVIGAPVYVISDGNVDKALATTATANTSRVFGIVGDTTIATTATGNIVTSGTFTATTGQWDAVTGQTGGLTAGAIYYLDPTTAGKMTATAPVGSGQYSAPIGIALSTTKLKVTIQSTILN